MKVSPVLPTGEAKTSAQHYLTKARCPFDEGFEEHFLKRQRTGDVVQSTAPESNQSEVNRRLREHKAERPASAKSSGLSVGAGSGGTRTASISDLQKRFKAIKAELAAESKRVQAVEERLVETQAQVAETQALVDTHRAQVAAFGAGVEGVVARSHRTQAQAEGFRAEIQDIQADYHGVQAAVAECHAQLAETRQMAQEAQTHFALQRPFAEQAARCQEQALLDCYKSLYIKEADAFRRTHGPPKGCTDAKQSLEVFMSRALPEEEPHMLSKGFTKAATDAAREEVGSFNDDFSPYIHELDLDLIRRFFPLLKPMGNPGWEQALVVVSNAQNASLSPSGTEQAQRACSGESS